MRSWPTMTRLISNITRSSALASAAGVRDVRQAHGHVVVLPAGQSVATSRYGTPPVRCLGVRPSRTVRRAALLGQGLPGAGDGRPAVAQPELHDAARVKHWLACDEHADQLADYPRRAGSCCAHSSAVTAVVSRRWPTSCARAGRSRWRRCRGRPACRATAVADDLGQLGVGRAGAQRAAQVGLGVREQAGAQLPVGGQPQPVAVAAERPGDRGDDADRRRDVGRPRVAVRPVEDVELLGRRMAALIARGAASKSRPSTLQDLARRSPCSSATRCGRRPAACAR